MEDGRRRDDARRPRALRKKEPKADAKDKDYDRHAPMYDNPSSAYAPVHDRRREEQPRQRHSRQERQDRQERERLNWEHPSSESGASGARLDRAPVQIVTRTKADSRPDDERQDRNRPPSRSLATNTRDKGAKQRISRDARVPPFVRCRFMDEDWRICADQVAPHLLESGDFTVVAALGCQGGGRSTVLSTLLSPYFYSEGATPSYHTFKVPLGIHSAQSFLEGQASPAGVDLCITTDRLVLLDAQPLFDSISASPDADLRSELFLNIFLASICHTILVVTDTAVDMQLWRFMRLLGSLKSKVPDLATWLKQEKQAPKEETKEVAPNLLVVFNNMSPDSEGALEEPVQSFLQRTEWKAGPIRCLTAPRLPGRSFQEMLCSEQAAALGARLRQNLFQQGNCQGCFGHSLQLTEKQWLHHVLDYWDFVQKHPAVQSYFDALMAGRLQSLDSPDPKAA